MAIPTNVQDTLGAIEIGVFIALFLFGIVTAQCWVYYQRFPQDPWRMKSIVAVVWFLEVGHTMLISCLVYTLTISYYGHAQDIQYYPCLNALILFGSAITWAEQAFFSFRIWKIMERRYLGVFCFCLSTGRLLACVVTAAGAFKETTFARFAEKYSALLTTVLVWSAIIDVLIALILCYFLVDQRDTSFGRTVKILDRLIVWTLQTGLATSVTAVIMVICFKTMPDNYIWLAVYMFLGKMYSNSLLASLNHRSKLRDAMGRLTNIPSAAFVRTDLMHPRPPPVSIEMSPTSPNSALEVVVEKHVYESA